MKKKNVSSYILRVWEKGRPGNIKERAKIVFRDALLSEEFAKNATTSQAGHTNPSPLLGMFKKYLDLHGFVREARRASQCQRRSLCLFVSLTFSIARASDA